MGLFSKLPEEPTEWAGLPSEPDRAETAAERLTDAAAIDLGGFGVGGVALGGGAVESVAVPVPPVMEVAEAEESGEPTSRRVKGRRLEC